MTFEIRDLSGMAEYEQAEKLQLIVWGEDDRPDPADLMMVIAHEGGIVAGAFEDGQLTGYIFGFPTADPHIQHSHRLAVLPQSRGSGLAAKLKWYQRDWCIKRGIKLVRWTFDPLRATNANLNMNRLGCTAGTYFIDYYRQMGGLNSGTPSDRLLAEWDLNAPHVEEARKVGRSPLPETRLEIVIPADFGSLLESDRQAALAERLQLREAMTAAFAEGLRVRGFDPVRKVYLLA